MSNLEESDDYIHEPNERPEWRESYYFNWVDIEQEISGFSTIGLLPNTASREFVFALFYDNKRTVHFFEPKGQIPTSMEDTLSDGKLSFHILKPMQEWRIDYVSDEMKAEIIWNGRFSPFDFGKGSGTSWSGHFEHSGLVSGTIQLSDGRKLEIKGYGHRDKSWGVRDWHIEGWYALHAQFEDVSIGLRRDQVKGDIHVSGGISTADGNTPIVKAELETTFIESPTKIPVGAITKVYGDDGSVYTIKSDTISDTSFVRFERQFPGGRTELFENMATHECAEIGAKGTGLIEWLFTHKE